MSRIRIREIELSEKLEKIFGDISNRDISKANQRLGALKSNGFTTHEFERLFRRLGIK
jgi:hypothetical protein